MKWINVNDSKPPHQFMVLIAHLCPKCLSSESHGHRLIPSDAPFQFGWGYWDEEDKQFHPGFMEKRVRKYITHWIDPNDLDDDISDEVLITMEVEENE